MGGALKDRGSDILACHVAALARALWMLPRDSRLAFSNLPFCHPAPVWRSMGLIARPASQIGLVAVPIPPRNHQSHVQCGLFPGLGGPNLGRQWAPNVIPEVPPDSKSACRALNRHHSPQHRQLSWPSLETSSRSRRCLA